MINPQYPGMNNFMNHYTNYPHPPNTVKTATQHGVANMPMLPTMGSVNPFSMGMNHMGGMPGYPPMGGMMGMPPVMGPLPPKSTNFSYNSTTKSNKNH